MRKSRQKRTEDTKSAIEAWTSAGFAEDYQVRFMNDMLRRLEAGRGMSTKQRNWLDSLHADGPPEPKGNPEDITRIDEALAHLSKDQRATEALASFRGQLNKGRKLSEKQEKFLNILLAKADHINVNGHYRPTDTQTAELRIALAVCRARIGWIGQNKPGTYKAYEKINSWMVAEELLEKKQIEENLFIIDEWTVNKVLDAGRVALREFRNTKHPAGSMRYVYYKGSMQHCLVATGPTVDGPHFRGEVQYECLVNGEVVWFSGKNLKKRGPSKKK
jgi:hypothetical protein